MKKILWEPEKLDQLSWRAKVLGGWMVVTEIVSEKGHVSNTSIYVQDQHHKWEIGQRQPNPLPSVSDIPDVLKKKAT